MNTIHSLYYYQKLMRDIRATIEAGRYAEFLASFRHAHAGLNGSAGVLAGK